MSQIQRSCDTDTFAVATYEIYIYNLYIYIYFYKTPLPTKDPNTDLSACIPYRLYGDGAEAHRILTAHAVVTSLQSTPNAFLTQASRNLRCLLCSSPAVLLHRLWRTAFCTMAEVAEVILKASVVVPYHGCYC